MGSTVTPAPGKQDFALLDVVYGLFNTHKADFTPHTLAGTPSLACYKDDGLTQSTAGLTLTADFDSVTGLNCVKVDTNDAFYTSGHDYSVVIAAGTVNSLSAVGSVVLSFSIGRGVNVTRWLAGALVAVGITGVPKVDLHAMKGVAQSATDLTDFADTGYDPSTHNVAEVDSLAALGTQAKADVNAEVVDVMSTDTHAQPGQGTPAATTSFALMLGYLYKSWRNKKTQTADTWRLYNDDAATIDQKASADDDGSTATKGEIATGP